ncbi:hypothetical protein [Pseudonocardia parietis]|uniref:Membrane-anchored protein n=1 Tax=Pseudonocardia parietis TaxID=570936 RepID=A0ABS4W3C6_9PSEU|nr:hypothetical protein [Pseudonocardia parietis]MBP2370463.1 putative membrane-anchored protein [Pseudonocardia parietis]
MTPRQAFVYRHPFLTIGGILAVELGLIATLHLVLGWSTLAIVVVGLVVLVVATLLMG